MSRKIPHVRPFCLSSASLCFFPRLRVKLFIPGSAPWVPVDANDFQAHAHQGLSRNFVKQKKSPRRHGGHGEKHKAENSRNMKVKVGFSPFLFGSSQVCENAIAITSGRPAKALELGAAIRNSHGHGEQKVPRGGAEGRGEKHKDENSRNMKVKLGFSLFLFLVFLRALRASVVNLFLLNAEPLYPLGRV